VEKYSKKEIWKSEKQILVRYKIKAKSLCCFKTEIDGLKINNLAIF
jgi:hypothetical protein